MQTPDEILAQLLNAYPALAPLEPELRRAFQLLLDCYDRNGLVLCCGNGGSAADCEHIVGELMKAFRLPRPLDGELSALQSPLPAISLVSQSALISAIANDLSPDLVYAQQVLGYGKLCPILLIALSTSGNSKNVLRAVEVCNALGMPSIAITGSSGGLLAQHATVTLALNATQTYQVQELTLPVYHALCAMVEAHYFS